MSVKHYPPYLDLPKPSEEKMTKKYIDTTLVKAEFTGNFQDVYSVPHIHALIDSIPAADVAKVKHGKWTATGLCSNCHKPYQGGCFSDYCPNCGVRMDGGI